MAALFPLIHPMLFEPYYLATLVRDESLLLGTMLTIAARYSNVLADRRGAVLHVELSQWVRLQLMRVMDGDPALRSICTVEALLLLSEWPMLPMRSGDADSPDPESEELLLLKPSIRYDAYAWSNIGECRPISRMLTRRLGCAACSRAGNPGDCQELRKEPESISVHLEGGAHAQDVDL